MIMHLATFVWRDGVTAEQVEPFSAALATLPAQIPQLRRYVYGRDLGLRPGNGDFGVCALVDDRAGLLAYLDHPEHQRAVRELALPFAERRTAVQIDAGDLELAR
jgi:hypothetical protein